MGKNHSKNLSTFVILHIKKSTGLALAAGGLLAALDSANHNLIDLGFIPYARHQLQYLFQHFRNSEAELELTVSGDAFAENPPDSVIEAGFLLAASRAEDSSFLTLARSSGEFIQASGGADGWTLEFRPLSNDRAEASVLLFDCDKPVRPALVILALQRYGRGGDDWADLCAWKRVAL